MPAGILSAARFMNFGTAGLDASTKLLNHFDASVGDTSASAHTMTANNGVAVSTAKSKFGGSSLLLDGVDDYISVTGSLSDFGTGTGNFTIEAWINTTLSSVDNGRFRTILTIGDVGVTGSYNLSVNPSNKLESGYAAAGNVYTTAAQSTTSVQDGTWRHVAVTRASNIFRVFVNGTLEATSGTITDSFPTPSIVLVGASTTGAGRFGGNIDELRFSNVARWTASFTPPGIPYS